MTVYSSFFARCYTASSEGLEISSWGFAWAFLFATRSLYDSWDFLLSRRISPITIEGRILLAMTLPLGWINVNQTYFACWSRMELQRINFSVQKPKPLVVSQPTSWNFGWRILHIVDILICFWCLRNGSEKVLKVEGHKGARCCLLELLEISVFSVIIHFQRRKAAKRPRHGWWTLITGSMDIHVFNVFVLFFRPIAELLDPWVPPTCSTTGLRIWDHVKNIA